MRSTEWLAIQSFRQDQDILSAINTVLIHTKLRLAGVEDEERTKAVAQAREELEAFKVEFIAEDGLAFGSKAATSEYTLNSERHGRKE